MNKAQQAILGRMIEQICDYSVEVTLTRGFDPEAGETAYYAKLSDEWGEVSAWGQSPLVALVKANRDFAIVANYS